MSAALLTAADAQAERLKALVLDTLPLPESRRAYSRALDDFPGWCQRQHQDGLTKATVNIYGAELESCGPTTRSGEQN